MFFPPVDIVADMSYYSAGVRAHLLANPDIPFGGGDPSMPGTLIAYASPSIVWPTHLFVMRDGPEHLLARGDILVMAEALAPEDNRDVLPD